MTYYLRTLEEPDPPFIALPVFPNRQFRHSAIYVNVDSGITAPADLAGKTVGEFALYGHDASFWIKGILSDDHGVQPERCRWVVGGFDWSMRPLDFVSHPHPADVEIAQAPPGKAWGPMLEDGEIDALISADVPQCVLNGSPKVRPLFDDPAAVERDYYRRTGIFPIMHTVAVSRELLGEHPDLARALYQGFCAAKDLTARRYRTGRIFNQMTVMLPWASRLVEDNTACSDRTGGPTASPDDRRGNLHS
ncbi:hypothetical protein GCM10023321_46660 [Pseudonocardia eucalypti]|uniref:4,5-dihydroxyphthalate decarboxylase n=1 Tax=Pseudonocardia eucalypti TaxID=648755 RepID=A0ABP9QHU6_9PSEU|nr:4,5-dihydroxyphthalate decarboxylase [Pseudonocardia eucalypti]